MPFISKGKTIGFRRIGPFEQTLRDLLTELSAKNFIGRVVFDEALGNKTVLLRIEMDKNRIVGLEAEVDGKLLVGPDAIPTLEQALDKGEGYAEIIQLDDHKISVDLEENPRAQVSLNISIPKIFRDVIEFHTAAKNDLSLLVDAINEISHSSCLQIEGLLGSKDCSGAIKGELCPDKVTLSMSIGTELITISSLDELKEALQTASNQCKLIEVYAKKE